MAEVMRIRWAAKSEHRGQEAVVIERKSRKSGRACYRLALIDGTDIGWFMEDELDVPAAEVVQVDPDYNPDYVMGSEDDVPRRATTAEREALGLTNETSGPKVDE